MSEDLDAAYRERAHLVAHLAALYPTVLVHGADPDEPGWPVLYVSLPTGQVSWHISPDDLDLFKHVPVGIDHWDGHDTTEKYRRVDAATQLKGTGEWPTPPQPSTES